MYHKNILNKFYTSEAIVFYKFHIICLQLPSVVTDNKNEKISKYQIFIWITSNVFFFFIFMIGL